MAAVAFSSDGAEAIERKSDLRTAQYCSKSEVELQDFYELERCVNWIRDNGVHRVALQFPDELLCDAASVTSQLVTQTGATLFVLGDTSYGSCCVDEVAAQHYDADAIIHFGRSCLSPTRRLPVLFVYGKSPIDVADCVQQFSQVANGESQKVVLMYDVTYHHAAVSISKLLSSIFPNLVMSEVQQENITSKEAKQAENTEELGQGDDVCQFCRCGRKISIPKDSHIGDYSILYIGKEGQTLTNLMMNFNKFQFYSYNPDAKIARKETLNVNKALMKRFYMIERAKDAGIVGIVVGTLGVADYLSVINRLKELVKKAGKKSYTFVVGKLNVAKLANFMEVDIFVLVSCMENTLIDSSEFYKPVVTPYEMEVACNSDRKWTGDYFTDFRDLLPGACGHVEIPETISEEDQIDVSLVTGKVRRHGLQEDQSSSAVIPRDDALAVSTTDTAAGFLSQRHWKGLEQKLGQTEPTKAVDGQKGIAAGYSNEQEHS